MSKNCLIQTNLTNMVKSTCQNGEDTFYNCTLNGDSSALFQQALVALKFDLHDYAFTLGGLVFPFSQNYGPYYSWTYYHASDCENTTSEVKWQEQFTMSVTTWDGSSGIAELEITNNTWSLTMIQYNALSNKTVFCYISQSGIALYNQIPSDASLLLIFDTENGYDCDSFKLDFPNEVNPIFQPADPGCFMLSNCTEAYNCFSTDIAFASDAVAKSSYFKSKGIGVHDIVHGLKPMSDLARNNFSVTASHVGSCNGTWSEVFQVKPSAMVSFRSN